MISNFCELRVGGMGGSVQATAEGKASLQVSSDGGKTFSRAQLPEDLEERTYTILDTCPIPFAVQLPDTPWKQTQRSWYVPDPYTAKKLAA